MERDLMDLITTTGLDTDLAVGDKAVLTGKGSEKWPGVWTVAKVNDVTYKLEKDGLSLKASKVLVLKATAARLAAEDSKPSPHRFLPGQLVKVAPSFRGRSGRMDTDAYYVMISHDMAKGRAKVVRLGGEGGGMTWTCSARLLVPMSAPGKWLLDTHCTRLNSNKPPRVVRTRDHGSWGHGLSAGTDEDLNCLSCQQEKAAGTRPTITENGQPV